MIVRKIEKEISNWIKENNNKALLITGARQIGKTYSIKKTLEKSGRDFVEINLIDNTIVKDVLESNYDSNSNVFFQRLQLAIQRPLKEYETIIFFDEIQVCKEFLTKLKFLVLDGRYKIIMSGSLLGVELNGIKSVPTGYLKTYKMYPVDFEEYLYSLNIPNDTINYLYDCYKNKEVVDEVVHKAILEAFKNYLVVGGMLEALKEYILSNDYLKIYEIHRSIIEMYKKDFNQYEYNSKKLKLNRIYDLIPAQLDDKNRRYNFKDVDSNFKFDRYENSFNWLIDSGVALPVFNVTEPHLPLKSNEKSNLFKLFLSDVGMLTSMYGATTQLNILQGQTSINIGAVYENFACQELTSHGFDTYYYNSHKIGELDFVLEYKENVMVLKIKSGKDYKIHRALNNVISSNHKIPNAIVFSNYNVSVENNIIYLPIYMIMFIDKNRIEKPTLSKIDLSNLVIK